MKRYVPLLPDGDLDPRSYSPEVMMEGVASALTDILLRISMDDAKMQILRQELDAFDEVHHDMLESMKKFGFYELWNAMIMGSGIDLHS